MDADAPLTESSFSRLEGVRGSVLCALVIGSTLAYSFQFISFLHAKEALLALGLVAFAILSTAKASPKPIFRPFASLWGLAAFSLILHVASGYAKVPTFSVLELLRMVTLLLIVAQVYALLGQSAWRFYLRISIILSAILVSALGLLQFYELAPALFPVVDGYTQRIYSVFGNQDLLGGYLALAIPLVLYEIRRSSRTTWPLYPMLTLLVFVLMLSGSRSAWLAAWVGAGIVLGVSGLRSRRTTIAVGVVLVTAVLACIVAPRTTVDRVTQSFKRDDVGLHARWWFWDGTARMIRDHPIAGVGPGNFAYWSPYYLGEALQTDGGEAHYHNELHTLHAHSDPLELFAETGFIGIVCVALFLWPLRRCRGPEWGALAALAVFASLNATWQSPPHALAGLLLLTCLFAREKGIDAAASDRSRISRYGGAGVSIGVALLTIGLVLVPSYRLGTARAEYDSAHPSEASFQAVADARWPNFAAQRDAAIALIAKGDDRQAEIYLSRARKGLDTGEMYFLQALIARNNHDRSAAENALRACLWRWPAYLPAWEMLFPLLPLDAREAELLKMRRWLSPEDLEALQ